MEKDEQEGRNVGEIEPTTEQAIRGYETHSA